jgi:hypothetical protein
MFLIFESINASSAFIERFFSKCGIIVTKRKTGERDRVIYLYKCRESESERKKNIHFHHYKTKRNKIYKHRVIIN